MLIQRLADKNTLVEWIKPEATAEELECLEQLKPGDYEIYSAKLDMIVDESMEVFKRTGVSAFIRSGDSIVGVYTAGGELACASCGTYMHGVTSQIPIKFIVKNWLKDPTVGVREGDIFYANDALYGGIHNGDQFAMLPIFYNDELIAWAAAGVHEVGTGAITPSSIVPDARSIYYEGLRLLPIKIGENYTMRTDLLEAICNIVGRTPRSQMIDMRSRFAAADRTRIRIQEIARERGNGFVRGLFRKMIIVAEEGARKRISSWNDGTYRVVEFHDTAGLEESLVRTFLTVRKEGDHLSFDFTGSSPETEGATNGFPHAAAAHAAIPLMGYAFHDLPVSAGMWAPLDWIVPEGTIYNASPDAANSAVVSGFLPIFSTTIIATSKMMFDSEQREQITAPYENTSNTVVLGGLNPWGIPVSRITSYSLNGGGGGARSDMDGVDNQGFTYAIVGRGEDAEEAEQETPFLILCQQALIDSAGRGKYRGGAGIAVVLAIHHVPWCSRNLSGRGARVLGTQGLFGGYPGGTVPHMLITNTDVWDRMRSGDKAITGNVLDWYTKNPIHGKYCVHQCLQPGIVVSNGDVLTSLNSGGAGYGDVLEREPELVMKDLKRGIISQWTAQNVYHVAYDPESLEADYAKTEELRQREKQRRLARGKTYQVFEKEWLQKRPPEAALSCYGSWPDAKPTKVIRRL